MYLKELTITEFNQFAYNHPMSSHFHTSNYAIFMAENNFEYEMLGLCDEWGKILSSALILIKKIGINQKYGYVPKGYLIDYFNEELLTIFTNKIKERYKKDLVFLKINPEIAIGQISITSKLTNYNQNIIIKNYLKNNNYLKLKNNLYFEATIPHFNAIISLKDYSFNNLTKNTKNKIRKGKKRGLVFVKATRDNLDIFFNFIKKQENIDIFYYKNYYNIFDKDKLVDLFLIKIDYNSYLINSKELYDEELIKNNILSNKVILNPSEEAIKEKMVSDKTLLSYKNDIEQASLGISEKKETYIAGAFIIKYKNRVSIIASGIDKTYRKFNANYFMFYNIIEYYKNDFNYLDMNGVTGDFTLSNPYKGLNDFKFSFKPKVYEFIGEYDLIINEKNYNYLNKKGILAKEFNKKITKIKKD